MVSGGCAWAGASPARGADVPARPPLYADAPDVVRTFLVAAKRAEALHDPLARCLAYPDYPGNAWPKGLAEAYCHYLFDPSVTLAMVRQALDSHAADSLEARFRADLERHFVKDRFSEIIHRDFAVFDASQASGQLTQRWLEQAPHSAYALTARGIYFGHMGMKARGGAWAKDTPPENMQRMSEFMARAIDLFQQAIRIEPRLLDAYVGLEDVANTDSRGELEEQAFDSGMAIDPACKVLTGYRMVALTPRWGGSYPRMVALANQLKAFLPQRPLLALNTEWPLVDLADQVSSQVSYEKGLEVLKPVVLRTAHAGVLADVAEWSDHVQPVDRWEQLMLLLEAGRFEQGSEEVARLRGRLLLLVAREPAWAQSSLAYAVSKEPGDAYAHYLLAASYWNAGDPARSEHDYVLAMDDASNRQDALYEVTRAMLQAKQPAKARRYVDRLNKEYPDDGPGWYLRASVLIAQGRNGEEVTTALRRFVATADRSDIRQAMQVREAERTLGQVDAFMKRMKAKP
ncbi:tetratricopeptide repeat protein [Frateuria sp. GZRR33]|uniref:tetratricopeptide repeat protein n=1 Tax=Frateuria sp. GZRR33 TaxID=3351535 RepID=UPI003F740444